MARYIAKRDIKYIRRSGSKDYVVVPKGGVVQGVEVNAMKGKAGEALRAAEKRAMKHDHNARLFFFKAWGVIRYAEAGTSLVHTRKQLTIPVEDKENA